MSHNGLIKEDWPHELIQRIITQLKDDVYQSFFVENKEQQKYLIKEFMTQLAELNKIAHHKFDID